MARKHKLLKVITILMVVITLVLALYIMAYRCAKTKLRARRTHLALPLLMPRLSLVDNTKTTFSTHELVAVTPYLYARRYMHNVYEPPGKTLR